MVVCKNQALNAPFLLPHRSRGTLYGPIDHGIPYGKLKLIVKVYRLANLVFLPSLVRSITLRLESVSSCDVAVN